MKLGIDVGGTHTDVVLLDNDNNVVASKKMLTSDDVTTGIKNLLCRFFAEHNIQLEQITVVKLGTTHLLNALLQGNVEPVAIIRIGAPATTAIKPLTGWPTSLAKKVNGLSAIVHGGFEFDGQEIAPVDLNEIKTIADKINRKGLRTIAITGVFSPCNPKQENYVKRYFEKWCPDAQICVSHELGGMGLLERENATVINASLLTVYQSITQGINAVIKQVGLQHAQYCLTHNDGSMVTSGDPKPLFTLNSGPTNSLRGGASLVSQHRACKTIMIIDIGGTSSDAGILTFDAKANQFQAQEQLTVAEIAGVNLKLPRTTNYSIALGGGTLLNPQVPHKIGKKSVGSALLSRAVSFGGDDLTVTDIAIARGRMTLVGSSNAVLSTYSQEEINAHDRAIHKKLAEFITSVLAKTQDKPNVVVLVGGGATLFSAERLQRRLATSIKQIIIPEHSSVANAIGAAKAEISGMMVRIVDYEKTSRQYAIEQVKHSARDVAISCGAIPQSLYLKSMVETPLNYLSGNPHQLIIKYAGKLDDSFVLPEQRKRHDKPKPRLHTLFQQRQQILASVDLHKKDTQGIMPKLSITQRQAIEEIRLRAIGHAYLGSGGGGDTRIAELMVSQCLKQGKMFHTLPLDELADSAHVVCFGVMGSPEVLEERLPSAKALSQSITLYQEKTGLVIDAIVPMEVGGINGIIPLLVASELDVPVIDGDTMGRALPGINMTTPAIEGVINEHWAILVSPRGSIFIEAESALALEKKARDVTITLGGLVFICYMPMSGLVAKKVVVPNTLTTALEIGRHYQKAISSQRNQLSAINQYLEKTDYQCAEQLFQGRITALHKAQRNGFTVGAIEVSASDDKAIVVFQNENLLIRINGKDTVCQVPDLITIVDRSTFLPISCGQLGYGQEVCVVKLSAPQALRTPNALKVIGPQAFQLDNLLSCFEQETTLQDMPSFGL